MPILLHSGNPSSARQQPQTPIFPEFRGLHALFHRSFDKLAGMTKETVQIMRKGARAMIQAPFTQSIVNAVQADLTSIIMLALTSSFVHWIRKLVSGKQDCGICGRLYQPKIQSTHINH